MKVPEFYLERRSPKETIAPEVIYRAYPQVGVFKSEEAFIAFLGNWYLREYGPSIYLGIRGERMLETPLRIGIMNYEVGNHRPKDKVPFLGLSMSLGQMGYVVGGPQDGHLVVVLGKTLYSLTNPDYAWYPIENANFNVRLLSPGEEVIIRGK